MSGNVFAFSFDQSGFEAIVNLTEIDEEALMAKMADEQPKQTVNSILSMMKIRAQFNQHRNMEVWIVKLDEGFTEDELFKMAQDSPQEIANLARMGECLGGQDNSKVRKAIT